VAANPEYNIATPLWSALENRDEAPCCSADGDAYNRRQLRNAIVQAQRIFSKAGVGSGSRVIVISGRGSAFWIEMIALWALGAVPIPLDRVTNEKHAGEIERSGKPSFISGRFECLPEAFAKLKIIDFSEETTDIHGCELKIAAVDPDQLAGLFFTSGTTGLPKGVQIRHEMLMLNMYATQSRIQLMPSDRLFIAIPFRFISSISHFLVAMLSGAAFHGTENRLMPKNLLEYLEENAITAFGGAPVQLRTIASVLETGVKKLRWVMSSGDHLSPEIIETFIKLRPDIRINTVYGLTEVAGRFCAMPPDLIREAPGSVGFAIPGMGMRILDDNGKPCAIGEVGHVYASGITVFKGYIGNPDATAKALDGNGLRTGDLGYVNAEGYLFLAGRSDSVFKRSGVKVSCLPIADALMETGMFSDVAVLPRDDEMVGAVPVAYIVMNDGQAFDRPSVMKALRNLLPSNHLPADFLELDRIPRTGSGKIIRAELME